MPYLRQSDATINPGNKQIPPCTFVLSTLDAERRLRLDVAFGHRYKFQLDMIGEFV